MARQFLYRIIIDETATGTWRCELFALEPRSGQIQGASLTFGEGATPRDAQVAAIERADPGEHREVLEGLLPSKADEGQQR